jgi:hypothetical protein
MVNLGYNDILLLGKIKSDMIQLFPDIIKDQMLQLMIE